LLRASLRYTLFMPFTEHLREHPSHTHPYTATDILSVLREQNWLSADPSPELLAWADRAASLLGPHAEDRTGLLELLRLVVVYDAAQILTTLEAHAVLARYAARDVIRHLALLLLDPAPFTSERFKEVVAQLKESLGVRSRDLFHPIRLALAGQVGEGALDRVILLLDDAAALPFSVPVKSVRTRILEFCAALN
jgi:glutamyl/glutaminyl-tRNA synthetase